MNELTILEIQKKKFKLNSRITDLINEFQKETNCKVTNLYLGDYIEYNDGRKVLISTIIEVKL